ncbi:MAG: hypothetical protein CMJ48_00935 [Planctomycetaceae bacterium]|nr:hypothetical protein [Planctomycetaceae bacterium]
MIFHCLNRSVARLTLFEDAGDYHAFKRVIEEAHQRVSLRILDFSVMPNHWHFVVWPQTDEEVSEFFQWLTVTHCMRWHAHHNTSGTGHLYQGRFKSFPVQDDAHLFAVLRYVQRNPVRANLSERAEDWRWSSAWRRRHATPKQQKLLAAAPLRRPHKWTDLVNKPQTESELIALRHCTQRGTPFGSDQWVKNSAARLGLQPSLRPRGRPRKTT